MSRSSILKQMRNNINHADYIKYYKHPLLLIDFKYFSPFYNLDVHANYLKFFKIFFENELSEMIELNLLNTNITYLNLENVSVDFFYKMLNKNINLYPSLNQSENTENVSKLAITNKFEFIDYVPECHDVQQICESKIIENGTLFKHIPPHIKITYEMYESGLNNGYVSFCDIPEKFRTYELSKLAVEKNGSNIQYVPNNINNYVELCKISIKSNSDNITYWKNIEFTVEFLKILVKENGMIIRRIVLDNGSLYDETLYEIYEIAVQQNCGSIKYIPEQFRTFEICKTAYLQNKYCSGYFPSTIDITKF